MSKVVAKTVSVQNSAGTATTDITYDGTKLVNTALDNAITAKANTYDLGVGQTWQNVTASRALGVTYTNSTGKPIILMASVTVNASGIILTISVFGVSAGRSDSAYSGGALLAASAVIPNGATYAYNLSSGSVTSSLISELR